MTEDERGRRVITDELRDDIAHKINGTLIGTGISVSSGGSKGPYQVTVSRLSFEEVGWVIGAILQATGRKSREAKP